MLCVLSCSARVCMQSITAELEHQYPALPAQGRACRPRVVPSYKCMHQLWYFLPPLQGLRRSLPSGALIDAGELWPFLVKCKGIHLKNRRSGKETAGACQADSFGKGYLDYETLLYAAPPLLAPSGQRSLTGGPLANSTSPHESLCLPLGTSLSFLLHLYRRLPFYPVSSILSISEGDGFLVVYTARHRSAWIALQKVLNLFWVRKAKEAGSAPAGILKSQTCPSIILFPAPLMGQG